MSNLYRKKLIIIKAWQVTTENAKKGLPDFLKDDSSIELEGCADFEAVGGTIKTHEGVFDVSKGDYIIKGANDEISVCKPDFFTQVYEPVNESVCTAPKDDRELTDDELKRIRETGSLCDCHEFVDSDDHELPNPITPEFLESQIASVTYTQLGKTLTHCQIEVKNGFVFTGESACADPENFDEVIGQKIAFENAKGKMWMPYGFLLKQQLAK